MIGRKDQVDSVPEIDPREMALFESVSAIAHLKATDVSMTYFIGRRASHG
jgi:hypothetical protein